MLATAPPAAAVGGCPSAKVCLYGATNYGDLRVTSASTKACFSLSQFKYSGIKSYVNNLPVSAVIWERSNGVYVAPNTLRPGGFSSNTGSATFGMNGALCMGGLNPNYELP